MVSSVAIWAGGAYHLTVRLGIGIAPGLTPNWPYPRIVWGGLRVFLFMLPIVRGHWWLCGIILSLAPTAFQMLYVFPRQAGQGFFGPGLGALTPLFVLAANVIWALSAARLLRTTGRA